MNNPYQASGSGFVANNPFSSSAQSRYPDLQQSPDPNAQQQFAGWMNGGMQSPVGFQQQQQQGQPFQQQQEFGMGTGGYAPQSPTGAFQPQSSFGQQLAAGQINGSSYSYLQGQQSGPPGSPSYNPVQQQLQGYGNVAQFDPYNAIAQGWDGSSPATQQPPQQQQQYQPQSSNTLIPTSPVGPGPSSGPPTTTSTSATGQLHPREYIRINKVGVESWDAVTWRHLLGAFDALKDAWEARKKDILGNVSQLQAQLAYASYNYAPGQLQQEIARLQTMAKDAESNHDSVAASSFQMHEVFNNYRTTSDVANKSLVREASNAAITSLPDWPPLAY
ncbi:hypothetical protein MKEN_00353300 [Mycena kentingensis (nom. inval.)]|nr:hypothetical protein MKEN_00353300 [Mycena kentingensis (nom. inval.)]